MRRSAALLLIVCMLLPSVALALGETEFVLPATSEHFYIDAPKGYKINQTEAGYSIQVGNDHFMFAEIRTDMTLIEYVNHYYDTLFDEYIVDLLDGVTYAEGRVDMGIPARYQINKTPDGMLLGFSLFPGEEYVLLIICTAPGESETLESRLVAMLEETYPKF